MISNRGQLPTCVQHARHDEPFSLEPDLRIINMGSLRVLKYGFESDAELTDGPRVPLFVSASSFRGFETVNRTGPLGMKKRP